MVSRSMSQVGKWSRRIGGGALVLALVGLLGPTTIPGAARAEVIIVHSCAPGWSDIGGTCWPDPLTEAGGGTGGGVPGYDPSGGYSGGGNGPVYGGGGGGGGGGGISAAGRARMMRLNGAKNDCQILEGVWGAIVFHDYHTDIAYAGYRCRLKDLIIPFPDGPYEWKYYDSEGYLNHTCVGDLEIQVCEPEEP